MNSRMKQAATRSAALLKAPLGISSSGHPFACHNSASLPGGFEEVARALRPLRDERQVVRVVRGARQKLFLRWLFCA